MHIYTNVYVRSIADFCTANASVYTVCVCVYTNIMYRQCLCLYSVCVYTYIMYRQCRCLYSACIYIHISCTANVSGPPGATCWKKRPVTTWVPYAWKYCCPIISCATCMYVFVSVCVCMWTYCCLIISCATCIHTHTYT